jgi:hypothetical protein
MTYLTKERERQQFLTEFLQRLREAPAGTRVYMRVGDVFSDADVVSIDANCGLLARPRWSAKMPTKRGEPRPSN